ncbi:MAG TPA: 6-carboxytetrahydropterin synthase [Holophagaceae bacterium]|jgi:6-pyruvoyl-tetrahydropterin synthase|nr:6-carboxytetrahydropterin synthase [Holophagaceae bacterium]
MTTHSDSFAFEAAVERPLSVVFRRADGTWEGHDYLVEVVAGRKGLDAMDVVVDFRDLEAALDALLAPMQGKLLSDLGLDGPLELAEKLMRDLAPTLATPAKLISVALVDGRGRRLAVKA